jgi:hypothetical protein
VAVAQGHVTQNQPKKGRWAMKRIALVFMLLVVVSILWLPLELTNAGSLLQAKTTPEVKNFLPFIAKDYPSSPGTTPTPTLTPTTTSTPTITPTMTPRPTTTPPPPADVPCLYALNWWRNPDPPYDIIRSSYSPPCLMATHVMVSHILDAIGRETSYTADVSRTGNLSFYMQGLYNFNAGGGVTGANVTKFYPNGSVYSLEITEFCPSVGQLVGYIVLYDGQSYTFGNCP